MTYTQDPMSQVQVEAEIMRFSSQLAEATDEYTELAEAAAHADVAYDLAFAKAIIAQPRIVEGAKVTVDEREARALIAVAGEATERKMTEAVYRAAQERGRNLRAQLDALRSINANVRAGIDYSHGRGA